MKLHENNALGELGGAIGKGLLAGIAATAAMTLSQLIEMQLTKREASDAPVQVAEDTIAVKPVNDEEKEKLAQELHWAYGSAWGIARGLVALTGLKGLPATLLHFGAVWGTAQIMLPKHDAAKPLNEREPKEIAIDVLHHAVYAITAGVVYDALDAGSHHERKFNKLINQLHLKGLIDRLF